MTDEPTDKAEPTLALDKETTDLGWTNMLELGLSAKEAPSQSDRYTIVGPLGQGGMGEVLEVVDAHLERTIALKRMVGGHSSAKQFLQEARVTGRLNHPNIVPVHDIGVDAEGRTYYTMKRIEGGSLQALIKSRESWSRIQRLQVFLKVCDAIGFAHAEGIVHRDLKPSNIMVGAHGEVLIVDWGLARAIGEPGTGGMNIVTGHSETSVAGTPGYMAPEQARGEALRQNERTDIYALGALLHIMLTGESFYDDAQVALKDAQRGAGPPVRPTDALFTRELRAIVAKACRPEASERFQTVGALRDEIVRFMEDTPLQNVRYSIADRLRRWMRHHRGPVRVGLAVGLTATVLLAISGAVYVRDVKQAQWETERQLGLTEVTQAELLLANSRIEEGLPRARAGLERLKALGIDTQGASLSARIHEQFHSGRYLSWAAGSGACGGTVLNANGSRGLSLIGNVVSLWALPEAQRLATWTPPSEAQHISLSFVDDRPTALWSAGETVELVTIPGGSVVQSYGPGTRAWMVRARDAVAVDQETGPPNIYDRQTGDILSFPETTETVWGFSSYGSALRLDPPGIGPSIWQVGQRRFDGRVGQPWAFSLDGRFAYTQSDPDTAMIHDLENDTTLQTTALKGDSFWFSPDTSVLMARTFDDEIVVRDTLTGAVKVRAQGLTGDVGKNVSDDGHRMLTCSKGKLNLYFLDGQAAPLQAPLPPESPIAVRFSTDGVMIAVVGFFDDIRLFEAGTRRAIGQFGPTPQGVRDVAFSPDDSLLAAAGRDGRVSVWDVATATLKNVHKFDDQRVCSVEWLDGTTLVALGCDGRLIRWQMGASPTTIWEQDGHTWKVRKTPAGMLVLTRKSGSPNLYLVDPGTGTNLAHSAGIASHGARYGIAVSPDGRLMAASSGEGAFHVHDLKSMTAVTTIGASLGPGLGVAFHKTQPILVTSTFRGDVVFWDTETWERLSTVQAHSSRIPDLAISPDGRWLASIGPGVLTVFDLNGALPWESTGALAEPLEAGELPSPDRTRALRRIAAAYGAPKLALSLLEDEIGPVQRARLLTLADDPGAAAAWRHAVDNGAVSPAALTLILASLEKPAH